MMDGSGAGFVSSGSCGVDISESSGCNYKVQVYYQRIRNLDAFALAKYHGVSASLSALRHLL
jgi:hypothetical protein